MRPDRKKIPIDPLFSGKVVPIKKKRLNSFHIRLLQNTDYQPLMINLGIYKMTTQE